MALVLEMPADTGDVAVAEHDQAAAEQAADLLDMPEAQNGFPPADEYDPDLAASLPSSDRPDPPDEKPAKKKRSRKKKAAAMQYPRRIEMVAGILGGSTDDRELRAIAIGETFDAIVDASGNVSILLDETPIDLEADEFKVIEWTDQPPKTADQPAGTEGGTNPSQVAKSPPGDARPADSVSAAPQLPPKISRASQIVAVECEYIDVCLRVNCIESSIEAAKDELKTLGKRQAALATELMQLRNANEWQPPLFPVAHPATTSTTTPSGILANDPSATGSVTEHGQQPIDPDAWRTVPLAELGLPAKLAEKLAEAGADTIGKLEDLRAKISQGGEKWPKGIGAARITEIENAVVKWLTANRDAAVFSQGGVVVEQSVPAAPSPATDATPAAPWEDLSLTEQQDFICARAVILDTGEENSLAFKHPSGSGYWDSGYAAGQRGDKVSECPMVPGDEQDDWLRGWLAFGKVEAYEPSEATPAAATPVTTPATQKQIDLDDL